MNRIRPGVLAADSLWSHDAALQGDLIVPEGRRLEIRRGVRVDCSRAPQDQVPLARPAFARRPQYLSAGGGRLIIAGELIVRGSVDSPAQFGGSFWGGIIAIGRGRVRINGAAMSGAVAALVAADFARVELDHCEITGPRTAAALGGWARVVLRRCRIEGSGEAGVLCSDDARALLQHCRIENSAIGAEAVDEARVSLIGCDVRGCAIRGLSASDSAAARSRGCRFQDCTGAVAAHGRSRATILGCRASGGVASWESFDEARLELSDSSSRGAETGLWVQNSARASCVGARFEGGQFGARVSHRARLDAREIMTEGQTISGILVENEAFASLRGCADGSARGGPALRDSARAELDGFLLVREPGVV